MVEITYDVIDTGALLEQVREDSDGAVATFTGVVRNSSDVGEEAEGLEYEAYNELALKKMREVIAEARVRWPIGKVAIVHRLGRLAVGEASVTIAIAAPHRQAAFEACMYTIDRLKETVPIWKKETTPAGASWK